MRCPARPQNSALKDGGPAEEDFGGRQGMEEVGVSLSQYNSASATFDASLRDRENMKVFHYPSNF